MENGMTKITTNQTRWSRATLAVN